jgi:hypothetical protein
MTQGEKLLELYEELNPANQAYALGVLQALTYAQNGHAEDMDTEKHIPTSEDKKSKGKAFPSLDFKDTC